MDIPLKREKFVKVCITIPKHVRERMAKHPEVNWSAVSRKAFVDICDYLDKRGLDEPTNATQSNVQEDA